MGIWENFDDIASTEEVQNATAKYSPVNAGDYEAVLENIEPSFSKNNLPMIKGKFRLLEGGRLVFYNQMLQNLNYPDMTADNIAEAKEFIEKLSDEEFEFAGLDDLATRVQEIKLGGTYKIRITYGKKDYDKKFPKIKCLGIKPEPEQLPFDV